MADIDLIIRNGSVVDGGATAVAEAAAARRERDERVALLCAAVRGLPDRLFDRFIGAGSGPAAKTRFSSKTP